MIPDESQLRASARAFFLNHKRWPVKKMHKLRQSVEDQQNDGHWRTSTRPVSFEAMHEPKVTSVRSIRPQNVHIVFGKKEDSRDDLSGMQSPSTQPKPKLASGTPKTQAQPTSIKATR